jgi:putative transcriptional regulator
MSDIPERKIAFQNCRKRLDLSQRQVCIDLGISDAHFRNIESGRGNPDAKLLFMLANYFGVRPEELFPDLAALKVTPQLHRTSV